MIIGGALVVLLVAGAVAFFLRPDSAPTITYQGKEIASAADVLTTAEKSVDATVVRRRGTNSGDTRCYFTQPTTPASGSKASDIGHSLRCGPVLFVDGKTSAEYLAVALRAGTAGNSVTLTPQRNLDDVTPEALSSGLKLVRPDGQSPLSGTGGLSVPQPPPAGNDSLVASDLGTIAFQLQYGDGAIISGGTDEASVVVDGRTLDIPQTASGEWDVVAVPSSSSPMIELDTDGFAQTLSLPDGTPGSRNIAVWTREHTTGIIGRELTVPARYTQNGNNLGATLRASATISTLSFWPTSHDSNHPSDPRKAYLHIGLTYQDSTTGSKVYGFDPSLIRLALPDGTSIAPRNIAAADLVYDVFEVPADYTTGILTITGSQKFKNGLVLHVLRSKSFRVNVRAG